MQLTKKTFYIGLAAASSLLAGSAVIAADGAALYNAKMCQTCHGPDGSTPSVSTYPKLGGQNESYLLAQIMDIRDGKRANGQTVVMKAMMDAMKVSPDEAKAIAKWIAEQPAKSNK